MATYVVTVARDESNGDRSAADLSLREAIELANARAGADEIRFADGVDYVALTDALPTIVDGLTIRGGGRVTIDANADGDEWADTSVAGGQPAVAERRVFDAAADIILVGLTVTGGFVPEDGGGGVRSSYGTKLAIIDSTISGNRSGYGGGISSADLSITNSTVQNNAAFGLYSYGGGIASRTVSIEGSRIVGNRSGEGGGLFAYSGGILTDSLVSENFAVGASPRGGGISSNGELTLVRSSVISNSIRGGDKVYGGGIYGSKVTLVDSSVLNNALLVRDNGYSYPYGVGGGIFANILEATGSKIHHNLSTGIDGIIAYADALSAETVTLANTSIVGSSDGMFVSKSLSVNDASNLSVPVVLQTNSGPMINRGFILSINAYDINYDNYAPNYSFKITNTGTIGRGGFAITAGDGDDSVENFGTIVGNVNLGPGNDVFNTSQGVFTGVVRGGAGNDHLSGNAAANDLRGDAGDDILQGGRGDDILNGGAGADRMVGGRGNDTYYVNEAGDRVVEGLGGAAGGRDTVHASVSFRLPDHVEVLFLTGKANINGTGNALANAISGNRGINALRGMDGDDVIQSGGGADVLIGGRGRDVFKYTGINGSTPAAPDRIAAGNGAVAFELPGRGLGDRIDLSAIDANALLAGKQDFVFGSAKGIGRLWAVNVGEVTMIRGNVDARPGPELQIAILDGWVDASAYTRDDFIL